jgi:hypothetical protein
MVEIVQNAGGYVFGRKRAESVAAPQVKPPAEEKHTPKPEVKIPKPKAEKKEKAEPKVHVIKKKEKEPKN